MTLGEYIRAARLQQAAVQLLDSPEKVTEMALAAGYATPAAFTKAFKAYFHVTPTQLRGFDRAVALLNVRHLDPVTKRKSRQMQVEIQTLPDQPVLYVRRYGAENNNFNRAAKEAYAALSQYIIDHDLRGQMGNCLAITPDEPGGVIPDAACRSLFLSGSESSCCKRHCK